MLTLMIGTAQMLEKLAYMAYMHINYDLPRSYGFAPSTTAVASCHVPSRWLQSMAIGPGNAAKLRQPATLASIGRAPLRGFPREIGGKKKGTFFGISQQGEMMGNGLH